MNRRKSINKNWEKESSGSKKNETKGQSVNGRQMLLKKDK